MRLGIISDIHGNAAALNMALEKMGDIDQLFCLGDAIDQFRFSNDVVGILKERDALTIWGNHEEMFFSPLHSRARSAEWIDPELLEWLRTRPRRLELDMDGLHILLTHATSWSDRYDYIFPHSPDFTRFGDCGRDLLFYGHTHHPVLQMVQDVYVVNPGSLGHGRLVDDQNMLSYAIFDTQVGEAEIADFCLTN
ncbi:metallophosphoesterase family protein [Sphingopyxis yananensis]|uniref:metallophosphoesterase family protein n=1 Tax=Sphingopyxis yananensis TaxID=2886687 RepID=UPI001D0F8171|nr:metallophosphoesterase family protein [Sphingopyxis yananensis]MCC2602384.1 metallophosphatase family protein [Sphingopyxis yananensis]